MLFDLRRCTAARLRMFIIRTTNRYETVSSNANEDWILLDTRRMNVITDAKRFALLLIVFHASTR